MSLQVTIAVLFLICGAPSLMTIAAEGETKSVQRALSLTVLIMGFVWIFTTNPQL